jgi:hypothetical protein
MVTGSLPWSGRFGRRFNGNTVSRWATGNAQSRPRHRCQQEKRSAVAASGSSRTAAQRIVARPVGGRRHLSTATVRRLPPPAGDTVLNGVGDKEVLVAMSYPPDTSRPGLSLSRVGDHGANWPVGGADFLGEQLRHSRARME